MEKEEYSKEVRVIIAALKIGKPARVIAEELGLTVSTISTKLKSVGLTIKGVKRNLTQVIRNRIPFWLENAYTLEQVAEELDVTKEVISSALARQKLRLIGARDTSDALDVLTEQVLAHIFTKGGGITTALRAIGIAEDMLSGKSISVRERISSRGIDIEKFYYAFRRYGAWLTQPGLPEKRFVNDKLISCVCLKCGAGEQVLYTNLLSGNSQSCSACRTTAHHPTKIEETGELFKNLSAAIKSVGLSQHYQKARYHLRRKGICEIGGYTFVDMETQLEVA